MGGLVLLGTQPADMMFDLIPLYVVPMFIALHIISLQRLGKPEASTTSREGTKSREKNLSHIA